MMLTIESCIVEGQIENGDAVAICYPKFFEQLESL